MAEYKLLLPKMGESVAEATLIKWVKEIGENINIDDVVVEIATDKVDSEVPSPVNGKLIKYLFNENDVAQVGDVIALLEIEGDELSPTVSTPKVEILTEIPQPIADIITTSALPMEEKISSNGISQERFYSPLVKNIAQQEGVSNEELNQIPGSGADGRLTKDDILAYIHQKNNQKIVAKTTPTIAPKTCEVKQSVTTENQIIKPIISSQSGDEIMEMDRMRKLIAEHMVMSVQTSPHVTSFVEADVTNIVRWRDKVKKSFEEREKQKITYTPLFIEAVIKALKDFPMINISLNGTQIIKKKNINIGMAAALPNGNLIVPVIKNADQYNLVGLSKAVNDLANRSKNNKLLPDETQNGTFTITNIGSFGNIMGTPIINQPQVAILAIGVIAKKPAVLETEYGDTIAIRHKMYLSLSYDHRVVDGALGGSFLRRIADYLENWDINRDF